MNAHLQRAQLLMEQSRFELAEKELRQSLVDEPDDALAHAVLAICLTRLRRPGMALREAELALGCDPEQPFVHYAKSIVEAARNCFDDAQQSILQAIGLDPYSTTYFAQLSRIHLDQHAWAHALEAADRGLALDPEDPQCANQRALALSRLGRHEEAGESLRVALKRNPEDPDSHANLGWSLLESGDGQQAAQHFREALRLDPENDEARAGIVEAMKARYLLYRIVLRWFLWMMNLSARAQWTVLMGALLSYWVLQLLAVHYPAMMPWVMPLLISYAAFALMTWVAAPLLDLALRMSRFGRLALSREQIATSNWVALCLVGIMLSLAAYGWYINPYYLLCALTFGLIIPPLTHIYSCSEGWPRTVMVVITIGLAMLAAVVLVTLPASIIMFEQPNNVLSIIGRQAFIGFLLGALGAQIAVNALLRVRPKPGSIAPSTVWLVGGILLAVGVLLALRYWGLPAAYLLFEGQ